MAISNNGSGGSLRGRFHRVSTLSEINVTPFVDVLLVLLVIFMVSAHVMEFGLEIQVPEVKTVKESAKELAVVSIRKSGEVYLGDKPVKGIYNLPAMIARQGGREAYIRADKDTAWDVIAQVLAELGEAKIACNMVTKPQDTSGRKR